MSGDDGRSASFGFFLFFFFGGREKSGISV